MSRLFLSGAVTSCQLYRPPTHNQLVYPPTILRHHGSLSASTGSSPSLLTSPPPPPLPLPCLFLHLSPSHLHPLPTHPLPPHVCDPD
ncbi:uncharacterized protein V6R79_005704 [Siganus canaliculatus]